VATKTASGKLHAKEIASITTVIAGTILLRVLRIYIEIHMGLFMRHGMDYYTHSRVDLPFADFWTGIVNERDEI
jgi:hypothetical protein